MTEREQRRPRRVPPSVRAAQERRDAATGAATDDAPPQRGFGRRPRFSVGWFGPFSAGVLVMAMLGTRDPTTAGQVLFVGGVAGTGYWLAHLSVRWLAARRER